MSTFVVNLNNGTQGLLDLNPSTDPLASSTQASNRIYPPLYGDLGSAFTTSNQRQIYVAGPSLRYRLLKDGQTFTDVNYWKQFDVAYGCDPSKAFIHTTVDDGTIWSSIAAENVMGIGGSGTAASTQGGSSLTVNGTAVTVSASNWSGTYGLTVMDFIANYSMPAVFLQIQNTNPTAATLTGYLNGNTSLTFTLTQGQTQTFNVGDLQITKIQLACATSCTFLMLANPSWT